MCKEITFFFDKAKRLPDKRNLYHLELFANDKLDKLEDDISNMMQKLDLFNNELQKDEKPVSNVKIKIDHMCEIFKTVGSFKTFHKRNPHHHELRTIEEEEETKQVEEIKMLEIYNESSINLDTCTLHELLTMLQ